MSNFMDCCGLTDIGRGRSSNEDQFLISDVCKSMRVHQTSLALDHQTRLFGNTQGRLLLVADGMGGHEAGERASQVVTDGIVDYVLNRLSWFTTESCVNEEDFEEQLKSALLSCQARIAREVAAVPQRRGMGSTLTMAYIVWPKLFLVHVGDSRCYLLRDGFLEQLTRDHTLANLAAEIQNNDRGTANDDQSPSNSPDDEDSFLTAGPMANILWNAIGGNDNEPKPDVKAIELRLGDRLILCSDGLSNMLTRRQIKEILSQEIGVEAICSELIQAANEAGGNDNISVVVSCFVDRTATGPMTEKIEFPLDEHLADTVDFEEKKIVAT